MTLAASLFAATVVASADDRPLDFMAAAMNTFSNPTPALIHLASAPSHALFIAAYDSPGLLGIAAILSLVYCMTWIPIGVALLGGLPQGRPSARSAS